MSGGGRFPAKTFIHMNFQMAMLSWLALTEIIFTNLKNKKL